MPRTSSLSSLPTVPPQSLELGDLPTEPEAPAEAAEALEVPQPKRTRRKKKEEAQDQHLSLVPQEAQPEEEVSEAPKPKRTRRTKVMKNKKAAAKKKTTKAKAKGKAKSKLKAKAKIEIPRNMMSEVWGVFFGGLSVLIMASLYSYNPSDLLPTAGVTHDVVNWVGPGGAQFAQFLLDFFGVGAFGLPLLSGYIGWLCFKPRVFQFSWVRAGGAALTVLATTSLLHVSLQGRMDVPYPVGGVVGLLVGGLMNSAVAKLGTVVISLGTFLVGLIMLTEKSIGEAIDWFTALMVRLGDQGKERFSAWRETRRLLREEKAALVAQWEEQRSDDEEPVDLDERQNRIEELAKEKALEAISQQMERKREKEEQQAQAVEAASIVTSLRPQPVEEPAWIGNLGVEQKPYQAVAISTPPASAEPQEGFVLESNPTLIDEQPPSQIPMESAEEIRIVERDVEVGEAQVLEAEQEDNPYSDSFQLPPLKLLDYDAPEIIPINEAELQNMAEKLERKFADFGIEGRVREVRPGPVVTTFEFVPAPGIKVSKIANLADDVAMAMEAVHVRIVAPIPGKGAVGIEIPNEKREMVFLKEIVADPKYQADAHPLTMALGKSIEGSTYFANLAEMPHVLISGTTGSGKSVSVNGMICSILYRASPKDVRFLMIDPKMLELSVYDGIPHLLLPPIIDSKKASLALKWAVGEMERRYQAMSEMGVRDLKGFNDKIKSFEENEQELPKDKDGNAYEHLPFIVVVVDEYADLLSIAGKDVESYVMRLAQKARACGIHVMLATQRPSVDVITGVIKANFPVRMGFRLASSHDSKTIVNRPGAEKLLGKGDMLIMPPGTSNLTRVHGAFVSEKELHRVVDFLKKQGKPSYNMKIIEPPPAEAGEGGDSEETQDPKYLEALAVVARTKRCSTSWVQRQLGVGYNRAARLVEAMERNGAVGPILSAKGDREIFVKPEHLQDGGVFAQ